MPGFDAPYAGLATSTMRPVAMRRVIRPRKFLAVGFASLAAFGALLTRIDSGADLWLHVLPALAFNSIFLLTVLPVTAMQTFREMEQDERLFSNAQQLKNMRPRAVGWRKRHACRVTASRQALCRVSTGSRGCVRHRH